MIKVFNHYLHRRTLARIFFDLAVLLAVMLGAGFWHGGLAWSSMSLAAYIGVIGTGMLGVNMALGFYERVHNRSVNQSRARAMLGLCLGVLMAYGAIGLVPLTLASHPYLPMSAVLALVPVMIIRVHEAHSNPSAMLRTRILVFGSGARAKMVGKTLTKADPHVEVVGYYAGANEAEAEVSAWGLLAPGKSLTVVAQELQIDEIVVALAERRGGSMPMRELLDCKLCGIRVVDMATYFEKALGQIRLDSVSAGWLIFGEGFNQGVLRSMVKRLFDISCVLLLLVPSLPVMLVTALFIRLESRGPVFYRQERVGLNGVTFNVIKFRSMQVDAEKDGKPQWAAAVDDRVTRVGRIIRRLRIDELPQFFNVLGGSMSLVGPRPERPYFVETLTRQVPYYAVRQSVKPGVTGWAQVRYHYGSTVEESAEKLQYDLYYVKNHTLFLDLVVLFETVGVVLLAKGSR